MKSTGVRDPSVSSDEAMPDQLSEQRENTDGADGDDGEENSPKNEAAETRRQSLL